jgi:phosphatidylserine/phosphatidylglycerophosphate/cardiolipin synthase-like enzyme
MKSQHEQTPKINLNPDLKVLSANGYFDSVTPFSQTATDLDNMPLSEPQVRKNLTVKDYPSGHMLYLDGNSRTTLKADLAALYDSTVADRPAVERIRALQWAARRSATSRAAAPRTFPRTRPGARMTPPNRAPAISTLFLRDTHHGGAFGQLTEVAGALADLVGAASSAVDVAIYDLRLSDPQAASIVVDALIQAAQRGVVVRVAYDAGKPPAQTTTAFAAVGGDPAPVGTHDWVTQHFGGTPVQTRAIKAAPQLMHSKYVVRDAPRNGQAAGHDATSAVWTGSTNFTDDAWTRQENNIIILPGADLAAGYQADFDQLWTTGSIKKTGAGDVGDTTVDGATVGWDFSPGDGPALDAGLVERIRGARERLIVAAMVLTSHDVLAALADAIDRGVAVSGIYDGGQMDPIVRQWQDNPHDAEALDAWTAVSAELARKDSTPYSPTGPHDFMHLKVLVSDGTVSTGSYNFSANAERNAENQVHLDDPTTVAAYVDFLATVIQAYS